MWLNLKKMEIKQIEELAKAYLDTLKTVGGNEFNSIPKAFIAGYQSAMPRWIEIKSKDDLPKVSCNCYFFDKSSKKSMLGEFRFDKEQVNFILANASHYCILNVPTPPQT